MLDKHTTPRQTEYLAAPPVMPEPMTAEEKDLLQHSLHDDIRRILEAPGGYQDSAFYQALRAQAKQWLDCVADPTQVTHTSLLLKQTRHDPPYFQFKHKGSR
jgi:hypothetical protein